MARSKLKLRQSKRQELRTARDMGGRRVAGSGNQPGHKGDVKDTEGDFQWLVENKYTNSPSYTFKLATWRKITGEAIAAAKEPAIQLDIMGRRLVIIDYSTWLMLRGETPD